MTDSEILQLISKGETSIVEFKTKILQPQILSREVSAFANTKGGNVLVGVDERQGIVGCDREQLRRVFEAAQQNIKGNIDLALDFVEVDGKDVGVITVGESHGVVSLRDGIFVRRGSEVIAMTPQEIQKRISYEEYPIRKLTELVAELTKRIEELKDDIRKSNHLKSKVIDYLIGGLVGAIIGFLFTLAFK